MKSMRKHLLCIALMLCMLMSLAPMTALAAEEAAVDSGNISAVIGDAAQSIRDAGPDEKVAVDLGPGDPIEGDLYPYYFLPYQSTVEELNEALRLRKEEIYLYMCLDREMTETELDEMLIEASMMGYESDTGDYLMCSIADYLPYAEYIEDGGNYYYIIAYAVAYFTTWEQEQDLASKLYEVQGEILDGTVNDYGKIKAIHDYIVNNVELDMENASNPDDLSVHSAYSALINGKATAQGYPMLFYRMAELYGIQARIIIGIVDNSVYMWNLVYCNGSWYNIDLIAADLENSDAYFMKGSTDFPGGHQPADMYLTEDFMQSHPIAETAFNPEKALSGKAGDNVTWAYNAVTNEFVISGTGRMYDDVEFDALYSLDENVPLVIEEGITYIGKNAFNDTNFKTVTLPASLTEIGSSAFSGSRISTVKGGENVKVIGDSAFYSCYYLSEIKLAEGLETVGDMAFAQCANLPTLQIPASVTTVGVAAFYGNPREEARIYASMTSIGKNAFSNGELKAYIVDESNPNYSSVDGILLNKDQSVLLATPNVMPAEFSIPKSVTVIGEGAFENRTWPVSIKIPEGITEIGKDAFRGSALLTVQIPSTVTKISEGAFAATELKSAYIPASVTEIGKNAFGYGYLASISYEGTQAQWDQISIGEENTNLMNTTVHKESKKLYGESWVLDLSSGEMEVNGFAGLVAPWSAWKDDIISVTMTNNAIYMYDRAFENCSNLKTITIQSAFAMPGTDAFAGCTALTDVYYCETKDKWVEMGFEKAFPDSPNLTIHYKEFPNGGPLGDNLQWSYDEAERTLTISGQGPMRDFGEYEARPWDELMEYNLISVLVLEEGVTSVGAYAFEEKGSAVALQVSFPSTLETIGAHAFTGCDMGRLVLNDGLKTVGEYAFRNCRIDSWNDSETNTAHRTLILPKTLERVEDFGFDIWELTDIYIPVSVKYIGSYGLGSWDAVVYYGGSNAQWYKMTRSYDNPESIRKPAHLNASCPHVVEIEEGKAATCTESGLTDREFCAACGVVMKEQQVIEQLSHYFEGNTCTNCGMVIDPSKPLEGSIGGLNWVFDINSGKLTVSGEGAIPDYAAAADVPWSVWSGEILSVELAGGVTAIGDNAFAGFEKLKEVNYDGTLYMWQKLDIGSGNEAVNNAKLNTAEVFTDVLTTDWFYGPVNWAVNSNVTGGLGNGLFGPNNFCTRAQVVTFLYAAAGKPEVTATENPFEDVADDAWYLKPVLWAVENGITGGTSPTTFGPDSYCTRAQVVTFLYAAAGKPDITASSTFDDVADSDWYAKPVIWAKENDVTGGISATEFGPNQTCTRAQVVTFLNKVYGS